MQIWKNFRTNLMYWRFRYVTRNRLRMQNWTRTRRRGGARPVRAIPYRAPGSASFVYQRSSRRTWIILLAMVAIMTAITGLQGRLGFSPSIAWGLSSLVVVASIYWALRGL